MANAVDVSRGNRLIPQFGRVANPQKVERLDKTGTKMSWQHCRTNELADSSANFGFLD
jgi:hypothetical protein